MWIALRLSHAVADNAQKQRRQEGFYATAVQRSLDRGGSELELEKHNVGSAKKDVNSTRISSAVWNVSPRAARRAL